MLSPGVVVHQIETWGRVVEINPARSRMSTISRTEGPMGQYEGLDEYFDATRSWNNFDFGNSSRRGVLGPF